MCYFLSLFLENLAIAVCVKNYKRLYWQSKFNRRNNCYLLINEVKSLSITDSKNNKDTTKNDNVVLIGKKPVMNYVTACITFFNSGEKQVIVKARGRAISRAVDTVELLRRAFIKDLEINCIDINTEELFKIEGQKSNVSTIEIIVAKAETRVT